MSKAVSRPSRRELVAGAAAAAGAAALAGRASAAQAALEPAPRATRSGRLVAASLAEWRAMVGTKLLVSGDSGAVGVTVVSAEPLKESGRRPATLPRREAFAVRLEGAGAVPLAGDSTTRLYHPAHGTFDLFLGGRSQANGRTRFVAIFN